MLVNVALWLGGIALIVLAVLRGRPPLARYQALGRADENARRYDAWRGGRRTRAGGDAGITGADVMRQHLSRQIVIWSAVGVAGVVLIVAGFALR